MSDWVPIYVLMYWFQMVLLTSCVYFRSAKERPYLEYLGKTKFVPTIWPSIVYSLYLIAAIFLLRIGRRQRVGVATEQYHWASGEVNLRHGVREKVCVQWPIDVCHCLIIFTIYGNIEQHGFGENVCGHDQSMRVAVQVFIIYGNHWWTLVDDQNDFIYVEMAIYYINDI